MSAPQPPADGDPTPESDPTAPRDSAVPGSGTTGSPTYEFHGEKLDFDPYRFGAPEAPRTWDAPAAPAADTGRPPAPGERWTPESSAPGPDVRPGDYWQGGGSAPRPGDVFPPAGYTPRPPSDDAGPGSAGGIDLGKSPAPTGHPAPPAGGYQAPPTGYPAAGNYPPPGSYPAPGGYPPSPQDAQRARGGNGLAIAGFVVGIVGLVLSFTSWPGIVIGLVGLGLSIAGFVRARRGASFKALAVTGIICSAIAVVVGSIVLVVVLSRVDFDCVRNANGNVSQAQECIK